MPDRGGKRIGSGGATLGALRAVIQTDPRSPGATSLDDWWQSQRVLVIHSGGDCRRLPQYSLLGKLFAALPVRTVSGDASTVFDEYLALSTLWAAQLPAGLVVASGDVLLTFDAEQLHWDRPGVSGVAMPQSFEVGSGHGVYTADEGGRVSTFLQKPTAAEVRAVGGFLEGGKVAVDTGLIRFAPDIAARLTELAGLDSAAEPSEGELQEIDLYRHFTLSLTGQWEPPPEAPRQLQKLAGILRGRPFWCDLVEGDFTHVGSTAHFQKTMTTETPWSALHQTHQRLATASPPGVRSDGMIVDSILADGSTLAPGSIAIQCHLRRPLHIAREAIAHGLEELTEPVEIPEATVVHQVPVALSNGRKGIAIRVYGVEDDPKEIVGRGEATWFGRPLLEVLRSLGIGVEDVWPETEPNERSLWNAQVFPVASAEIAWACARWLMCLADSFSPARWRELRRLSLATSSHGADRHALATARARRMVESWARSAVAWAESGADIQPLIAQAPGAAALAVAGRMLSAQATEMAESNLTEAASWSFKAGAFLSQAWLEEDAERARSMAFRQVRQAVEAGVSAPMTAPAGRVGAIGR